MERRHLNILGTRGIPAAHGGFETFAERLALWLVRRGVSVSVYCQSERPEDRGREDCWRGVRRVHFAPPLGGAAGTMAFDLACIRHVLNRPGVDLVLGYNTAVFSVLQKLRGRRVFMNMDGIEWKRAKWSLPARAWLMLNELVGARICDRPVADHPQIAAHVAARTRREPEMIPYGADVITHADEAPLRWLGLERGRYFLSVARIEPENSILEIVEAFGRADCGMKLVVLGRVDRANRYHRRVLRAAGPGVLFPGGIYEQEALRALRFHARAYFHGHRVGGTNPSLVEALGAGNAVIAHDNRFNRWTAGAGQRFFSDVEGCAAHVRELARDDVALARARAAARARHARDFRWEEVLTRYEALLFGKASARVAAG